MDKKVAKATKWSIVTEIIAKLISPLANMILARILVPEAFGSVATITMIISFAEVFTDKLNAVCYECRCTDKVCN